MNATGIVSLVGLIVELVRKRKLIKDEVLPLVDEAQVKLPGDSASRRAWVVSELIARGFSESDSRWLTESGVKMWKRIQAKRTRQAAKRLRRLAAP